MSSFTRCGRTHLGTVIPALWTVRKEDCKFKACLGYIASPCLQKINKNKQVNEMPSFPQNYLRGTATVIREHLRGSASVKHDFLVLK
jgi:hypothetical protein